MTVANLILKLKKYNPNLLVAVDDGGINMYSFEIVDVQPGSLHEKDDCVFIINESIEKESNAYNLYPAGLIM